MGRTRQIQELILARQDEERQFLLKLEEVKLQAIVGSIHAAAGNRRGVKAAAKIRLARVEKDIAQYDSVAQLFGAADLDGPEVVG